MCKTTASFFIFFFSINAVFSQLQDDGYDKFGASLKLLLSDSSATSRFISTKNGLKTISVFIETMHNGDGYALRESGYNLRTVMGNVATADIPYNRIYVLATNPAVKRIELPLLLRKEEDTLMLKFTTVQQVQNGMQPLKRAYKGDSILIGIIDDGADISHPDFYDKNNNLRIKYLWNMDLFSESAPAGYNYGTEWTADEMKDSANSFKQKKIGIYQMQKYFGYAFHGTSVTSLAAGNDGVAPHATIVSVALTATIDTLLYSDRIIDGIAYIYSIAQKEKKKCVINISLGTPWGGPHDGKTLLEKAIDNFCYAHPDVLVCVSAGNGGNDWKHWGGFPINKDSSFGFFRCAYKASLYFSIPKNDSKTINISIGEAKLGDINNPNISRDSVYYQTPFLNIDSLIESPAPAVFTSYLPNGQLSSYITFTASHYDDDYDELIITTDEKTSGITTTFDDHLYRFILKGTGTVHAWYPFLNLHPIFYFDQNPYPNDSTYHNTDNDYSTNIPANAFTVLSSGAYNLRTCYKNIHNMVVSEYEKCRTTYFTSHGPTLDGRVKPDVLSPGDNVFAARSRFDDYFDFDFIVDTNTVSFGGTSASSPITAGIAALAWEKFPAYSRDEIINLLKSSANFDSYCAAWGNKPNNIAGWGKIDAFKALTGEHINTNDLCMQNDDCIIIDTSRDTIPLSVNNYFTVFPNPVQTNVSLYYVSDKPLKYYLFDVLGRLVLTASLPVSNSGSSTIYMQHYSKGVYFLKVTGWNKPFTKKIILAGR